MVQSPLVVVLLFLALWIAVLSLYGRYWRRTKAGQEWREFNSRLNPLIRSGARSMRGVLFLLLGSAIFRTAFLFRINLYPDSQPGGTAALAAMMIVVSSFAIAVFPAQLLTNIIWRLVPPMRDAARAANVGFSSVSFSSANRLLLAQAVVIIPICLAQLYFGVVMR